MISLERAIYAADERKTAAVEHDDRPGLLFTSGEFQDRAIFSGLDVDYDELTETASRFGHYFAPYAGALPLVPLFTAAWVEGLLIGLLAAQLGDRDDGGE